MNENRRKLILALGAGAVTIPLYSFSNPVSANSQRLDPKKPPATMLDYRHKSKNASKVCAGCQFFTQPTLEWGPCQIFPGKLVSGKGSCKSWYERAG